MTSSMPLPTPTANGAQVVAATTPEIAETLTYRRKNGERRIPITAIKNRARPPPEASRKRKMEMDQGFVEAEFQIGEHPLGLVVDWSMALPVVSGVLPGTHASVQEDLRPGLVLLAINEIPLVIGVSRYEVERILTLRPLSLLFEAPTKVLFEERIPIAWQRSRRAAFYDIPQGETGRVDHLSVAANDKKPTTANSWSSKNDAHTAGDKARSSTSMTSVSFPRMDFFEEHPERSPLSRFGDLNIMNPNPFSSEARYRMARTLPSFGQGGSSSMPQLRQITATPASADSMSKKETREGPAWGFWLRTGSRAKIADKPRSGISGKGTRGWQGVEPDMYYKQLLDEEKLNLYGAGSPHLWPLGHEMEYECRFGDMILCSKVREAYEVGFRGKKRDKPTDMEKLLGGTGDAARGRRIAKVEQVSCDNCGLHLADADKPGGRFFYYCRQCKRSGRRFELCVACHVLEILQGEGKHSGVGFHPHYLKCKHRSLIRRQSLENAYPSSPHLHRVLCDLCGSVVVGRGASDKSSVTAYHSTQSIWVVTFTRTFFLSSLMEVPAYLTSVCLINWVGRRRSLCYYMMIGGAACLTCLFFQTGTQPVYRVLTTIFAMIGKFGISASFAVIYIYSAELLPTVVRNVGMGVCSMASRIGGICSPFVVFLGIYTRPLPMMIFGMCSFAAGLLSLVLPETLNKPLPESLEETGFEGVDGLLYEQLEMEQFTHEMEFNNDAFQANDSDFDDDIISEKTTFI